ncbi:SulP family inorganic anion transporter, partial [Bacillus thuringiensis]|uniref:SulP family inorganic anion transporter n=1 Tax=Bacillus thuringiensis TaxID=1428 RepID=UPI0011455055
RASSPGKARNLFYNRKEIGTNIAELNPFSILTAFLCLGIVIAATKWLPQIAGALLGLVISSLIATLLFPNQIETIGTTYGDIPYQLPDFQIPEFIWDTVFMLLPAACIIAALGGIESLLSAMVADNMANSKHNSNKELVGQGIANMVAPLFGVLYLCTLWETQDIVGITIIRLRKSWYVPQMRTLQKLQKEATSKNDL